MARKSDNHLSNRSTAYQDVWKGMGDGGCDLGGGYMDEPTQVHFFVQLCYTFLVLLIIILDSLAKNLALH